MFTPVKLRESSAAGFGRFLTGWNIPALAAMVLLTASGILFIGCIGGGVEGFPNASAVRQMIWGGIGLAVWFCFSVADYRRWKLAGPAIYLLSMVLLVAVLIWGNKIFGARRWLILNLGFFRQQMQPSELAKIGMILLLALMMSGAGFRSDSWRSLGVTALLTALPFALVAVEPDLGGALIFLPIAAVMVFVRGFSWRKMLIAALLLTALAGALTVNEIYRIRPVLKEYHRNRIKTFLDPESDPLGRGYNACQARLAVGSGGLFGKGVGEGDMSGLGFIPRTVANNDFIFAVIAEEGGYVGAVLVLLGYAVLIGSCFTVAWRAPDLYGRTLAAGFGTMLFCHVYINIGMNIGLAPVTGIPLPLLSYGGTFLVTTMAMLGVVQSISRAGAGGEDGRKRQ